MSISPGENVGPYRIIEQLGSGGMATVYKAYHPSLDRYVAIKVLHPAFKANPQFFERFQREARIVAKLEHPHIIPVYDFNEHQGEPYLVMRFVEGDTLKPRMSGTPMPSAEILHLMRPVCQALTYAHKQGVLHRDIKPSNIMVAKDGEVFLTDFGLARMVQAGESTLSQDMMVGTPQYISPEQAQGLSELDGRTDIYSLGVVLYEMITGRVPFSADTPFATVHDHIYTPLPLPSSINSEITPEVERLLLKALAKEPDDRFATTEELLNSLETTIGTQIATPAAAVKAAPVVADAPSDKTKVEQPKKGGLPWWVWAASAILVICVAAAVLLGLLRARRLNQPPAQSLAEQSIPAQPADQTQPPPANQAGPPPAAPPPSNRPPQSPEQQQAADLSEQATRAMQQRDFAQAADLYRQAITADPRYLPAYFGLSEALRLSGDPAGSQATLEEAVANNPDNPLAYQRLGESYLLSDNPAEALTALEQAIALDADNPELYGEQAIALLAQDQDQAAKQAIDQALALDQFNPHARLANGVYLFKQGEIRSAALTLRQLAQDARAPVFVQNRAKMLLERLPKANSN